MLPHGCKDFYEARRAAVLCGQACVKEIGASFFMPAGGADRGSSAFPADASRPEPPPTASAAVHDRQLVHMLANMCWQQRPEAIMSINIAMRVDADHLRREAFLYVRQSSLRQVFETPRAPSGNTACAIAQWRGAGRSNVSTSSIATWASPARSRRTDGFQDLLTEVAMGHAGFVLGREVSRLARNNADWHRLLELAALSRTLMMDEDGVYDPASFNDRMLLGLKGTMRRRASHSEVAAARRHSQQGAPRRARDAVADRAGLHP